MDGRWIRVSQDNCAVVFVHGILSSGEACWQSVNGCYWPELLSTEAAHSKTGIYVYTYQTGIFSSDYHLSDVVDDLKERLRLDRLLETKKIIFVCHSMGGIAVRKLIVERASDLTERGIEIGLFLLASPSLGSSYANFFSALASALGNTQADALRFSRNNYWLDGIDKEFMNLKESGRLKLHGKELVEDKFIVLRRLFRNKVVEPFSGARYFGERYKVPSSNHFTISKPENKTAIQHRLLCQFINEINGAGDVCLEAPKEDLVTLEDLAASHPLLMLLKSELDAVGISHATAAAILVSDIPHKALSDFYLKQAAIVTGQKLYGIASCALEAIDKFGIGHEALERCLSRLDANWLDFIALEMSRVTSEASVLWCHKKLTEFLKNDARYHQFIDKHIEVLASKDSARLTAYLLFPDRGPAQFNLDSIVTAIESLQNPQPLITRLNDWIRAGRFDGNKAESDECAEVLYRTLNYAIDRSDDRFDAVVSLSHERVRSLLKSSRDARKGLYHLISMIEARYKGANDIYLDTVRYPIDNLSSDIVDLYKVVQKGFSSLVGLLQDPSNKEIEKRLISDWLTIAEKDRSLGCLSGFWKKR